MFLKESCSKLEILLGGGVVGISGSLKTFSLRLKREESNRAALFICCRV